MSIFKLEVGGKCANGAVVLSLWCDDNDDDYDGSK